MQSNNKKPYFNNQKRLIFGLILLISVVILVLIGINFWLPKPPSNKTENVGQDSSKSSFKSLFEYDFLSSSQISQSSTNSSFVSSKTQNLDNNFSNSSALSESTNSVGSQENLTSLGIQDRGSYGDQIDAYKN